MGLISLRFADRDFFLDDLDGSDLVAKQMQQGFYEAPLPMLTMAIIVRNPGIFLDVGQTTAFIRYSPESPGQM